MITARALEARRVGSGRLGEAGPSPSRRGEVGALIRVGRGRRGEVDMLF
jgi:hypothetical protein